VTRRSQRLQHKRNMKDAINTGTRDCA
jgi:hypothetical protein